MPGMWRVQQWLGWPTGDLVAAVAVDVRTATLVALRDRPLRVVATGTTSLEPGEVRDDGIRLVGSVAARLDQLREDLRLPRGTRLVSVQRGIAAPGPGEDDGEATVVRRSDRLAFEQAAHAAGFRPLGVVTTHTLAARAAAVPPVRVTRRLRTEGADLLIAAGVDALAGWVARAGEIEAPVGTEWQLETIGSPSWS